MNSNVALREVVTVVGPDVRFVSGAVVSAAGGGGGAGATIVQLQVAGVGSTFPAVSVARTSIVWAPTARPASPSGDAHAFQVPPSRRHWNVEPVSVAVNDTDAVVAVVDAAGPPVIVVSGGVVSAAATTVQLRLAGDASVLPAASVARTSNVCEPTAIAA